MDFGRSLFFSFKECDILLRRKFSLLFRSCFLNSSFSYCHRNIISQQYTRCFLFLCRFENFVSVDEEFHTGNTYYSKARQNILKEITILVFSENESFSTSAIKHFLKMFWTFWYWKCILIRLKI